MADCGKSDGLLSSKMRVQLPFSSKLNQGVYQFGRLSALGVVGCGFKPHLPEMILELVFLTPLIGIFVILITPRENIGRL